MDEYPHMYIAVSNQVFGIPEAKEIRLRTKGMLLFTLAVQQNNLLH